MRKLLCYMFGHPTRSGNTAIEGNIIYITNTCDRCGVTDEKQIDIGDGKVFLKDGRIYIQHVFGGYEKV